MFATLNLERDPLKLADMLHGLGSWVQDAGGFCLVLLLAMMIWARARWPGGLSNWLWGAPDPGRPRSWAPGLFNLCLLGAALGYTVAAVLSAPRWIAIMSGEEPATAQAVRGTTTEAARGFAALAHRGTDWAL